MTVSGKNVLYMDTAGAELMLGISVDGTVQFRHREGPGSQRYHSALLIPAIQQGLKQLGLSIQQLDAVCLNAGPGSFTGIRTGIATGRTLAQFLPGLGSVLHVFNTFELLAGHGLTEVSHHPAVAIYLDARRERAYHAMVGFDSTGPFYVKDPTLAALSDCLPERIPLLVSASLEALLLLPDGNLQTVESLNVFTPEVMMHLLGAYGHHFRYPWQEVKPLYLQEPSITQRKTQT